MLRSHETSCLGKGHLHRVRSVKDFWVDMSCSGIESELDGHPDHMQTYGSIGTSSDHGEHSLLSDDIVYLGGWTGLQLEIAASEVRDHLSNERTFLSTLKLSLYLSIVGVSSLLDVRLPGNNSATTTPDKHNGLSQKLVMPLTYVFFFLALANLGTGTLSYYRTQARYLAKVAFVQEHWSVRALVIFTGISIISACLVLVSDDA